jgi:hypothetical protein
MNFLGILLALSIVTALFGSYCATRDATNTKDIKVDGRDRSKTPHLHFVDRKQFADLYESDSHQFCSDFRILKRSKKRATRRRNWWALRYASWKSVSLGYRATARFTFAARTNSGHPC